MTIDYLKKTLTARVYDVAHETPLELAPTLSQRFQNRIYFKREDMACHTDHQPALNAWNVSVFSASKISRVSPASKLSYNESRTIAVF